MRRFGKVLEILGVIIGGVAALGVLPSVNLSGIPWLMAVGLVKLTLAASLGMIATGAVLQRIARLSEERGRLSPPRD
jgi:hypothetical protein